jgi:hypothetical protein
MTASDPNDHVQFAAMVHAQFLPGDRRVCLPPYIYVIFFSLVQTACGGKEIDSDPGNSPGQPVQDSAGKQEFAAGDDMGGGPMTIDAGKGVTEAGTTREAGWSTGESCIQGAAIRYVEQRDSGNCLVACACQPSGQLQCVTNCTSGSPRPQPAWCAEGMTCQPGSCSGSTLPGPVGCVTGCACNPNGQYQCTQNCGNDCGLPDAPALCRICQSGAVVCVHYVLLNGACAEEVCPEDGPIIGI